MKPAPVPPLCLHCNAPAELTDGERIYPHRPDLKAKRFWLCACGAYCGCHGKTSRALGRPADAATRTARQRLHAVFDPVWKSGRMGRREAYAWLAQKLRIEFDACHVSLFDKATCDRAVEIVLQFERTAR